MGGYLTERMIEKFETGEQVPQPQDIITMAEAYKKPELCNFYCSQVCAIGQKYTPSIEIGDLSSIVIETIASLYDIKDDINDLVSIARDGKISDDEISKFAKIYKGLSKVSLASDSLNLWVEKTISNGDINSELFNAELEKLN